MSFLEELESFRIPFPDIEEATKNFTTRIGRGGYGLVYKGELLLSGKLTTVAVKRLDGNVSGQGFKEFLTEIQLLTRYKHPNLISLIGFCDQDNEKILIYEHAEHGSLDKYLSTAENRSKLTWKRRINICVNAARGLNYLHNEVAPNERVIHRDIKSANVLLDKNWTAMISDLGLSKLGRANEKDTFLITNASGTHGYCDPVYISSGILTKESDVYSFGVVLFEVLCGRLCFINVHNEHRFLPPLAQRYCKIGKIDEIMDPALKNQIDSDSLDKFSKIASQCLQNNRKRRPSMRTVVKKLEELEKALEFQQRQDTNQLLDKTQAGMDGAVLSGGEPPNWMKQFKRSLDDMQNNLFVSSMVKTKKRVHDIHTSDSMQQESLFKANEVEPDQHKSEHVLESEIAKFSVKGGLVDFEGVEKLIQLMKLESRKKNMDIACRVMLADVISVTDNKNCLTQFVENRGLHVLDEWLQEVNKGKIGDGTSIKGSNNSIEEFLFALLRALDVLPVDLRALQSCNVGKSVNHLRSYKNSEIQKKSKSLVDEWKRRVEAEMNISTTQSGISGGGPWPNKSVMPINVIRPQMPPRGAVPFTANNTMPRPAQYGQQPPPMTGATTAESPIDAYKHYLQNSIIDAAQGHHKLIPPEVSPSSRHVTGSSYADASMSTSPPSVLTPQQDKPKSGDGLSNLTVTGMKKALDSIQQNSV